MASPKGSSDTIKKEKEKLVQTFSFSDETDIDENSGFFFTFFNILFKYGHAILALSFTVERSSSIYVKCHYSIQKNKAVKRIYGIFYAIVCGYWFIQLIGAKFAASNFVLINCIKRGTHGVFLVRLIVTKYYLEFEGSQNTLLMMLTEADNLQRKFANFKISFPGKFKTKLMAYLIAGGTVVWGVIHVCIFLNTSGGQARYTSSFIRASTLNLVDFELDNLDPTVIRVALFLGTIMETITWAICYFGDAVLIFTVIAIWIVFQRLIQALKSGSLDKESIAQVMDLHLSATNLISLMNEILSTPILWSIVYTILYACFWSNHIMKSLEFSQVHIISIVFTLKNVCILLVAADVNTKAHKITFWLENCCRSNPEKFSKIDPAAMSIWTCQLYNKDSIGFKGMNYFTITPVFISGMLGLIITYTAVVIQFIQPH